MKFSRAYCINPPKSKKPTPNSQNILTTFKPESNKIDKELYEAVVDKDSESSDSSSGEGDVSMVNNQMDLKDYFVEWMQSEGSVQ